MKPRSAGCFSAAHPRRKGCGVLLALRRGLAVLRSCLHVARLIRNRPLRVIMK